MSYILSVEESILELNESEIENIVKKAHRSFRDLVLKQLHEHCYSFSGIHGGKNHHPFLS